METETNTRIKKLLADKFCLKMIIALLCAVNVMTITIIMFGLIDTQPNKTEYKFSRIYPKQRCQYMTMLFKAENTL